MALRPNFSSNEINRFLQQAQDAQLDKIIRLLKFVGEKAVNEARANGTYQDRTANLRNSIGYVIVVNGKIHSEDWSASVTGTTPSSEDPIKYGKALAYEIAIGQPELALIVVSGMKYGLSVEARGLNVLTSAEQVANTQLPLLLSQLK